MRNEHCIAYTHIHILYLFLSFTHLFILNTSLYSSIKPYTSYALFSFLSLQNANCFCLEIARLLGLYLLTDKNKKQWQYCNYIVTIIFHQMSPWSCNEQCERSVTLYIMSRLTKGQSWVCTLPFSIYVNDISDVCQMYADDVVFHAHAKICSWLYSYISKNGVSKLMPRKLSWIIIFFSKDKLWNLQYLF